MIFSSFEFLTFFLIILTFMVVLPNSRYRKWMLLGASYYFYASWDYRFTSLIFASTIIDYFVGRSLPQTTNERNRKLLLFISIFANLGFLGFFKYYNFFVDSASVILSSWGLGVANLDIILPVGISFYTFQTMSYTIDIYRRELEPVDNFFDFALFVAFFPQLVAGPIVRAADFLPQLKKPVRLQTDNLWAGFQIFTIGLFKKLMIADAVAPFVDRVYEDPTFYSSWTVWLAVLAYSIQIYGDFSGYSDMAIGCARILGFQLNQNFNMPYISKNVTEFWQRWHISLSTWLRDYLYVPLGGNRKGRRRTYINLMITMLLGGLWHGASWNFVIWGFMHGLALAIHRMWHKTKFGQYENEITQLTGRVSTFVFVTLIWVLFRAQTTEIMMLIYSKLAFITNEGANWYYTSAFVAMIWMIVGHIVGSLREEEELIFFNTPFSYRAAFTVTGVLMIIYIFAPTDVSPFIYFQF